MNPEIKNEVDIELENIQKVIDEINKISTAIGNKVADNTQKTALAAYASQFYNGIENILKRIHKHLGISLPVGENWHIQLLQRFSKESNTKIPIKFNDELHHSLNDIRRFRHYFFHGYSYNIDWKILKESISNIEEIFDSFKREKEKF